VNETEKQLKNKKNESKFIEEELKQKERENEIVNAVKKYYKYHYI